jgi:hypothetical protein
VLVLDAVAEGSQALIRLAPGGKLSDIQDLTGGSLPVWVD